jgi:PIN domain nuclease of toxin-antitoxin system
LAIAGISLWEIAWLVENKRIETALSVESFVRDCASKVRVIPETPEIAARAVTFPTSYPRDPQDRLIGATAIVEGIPLVTHDKLIRKSRLISTIW